MVDSVTGFEVIDPKDMTDRGRDYTHVSETILKGFMAVNAKLARVQTDKEPPRVRPSLNSYIKRNNLPIKLFERDGVLYMERTDLDNEGHPLPVLDMH